MLAACIAACAAFLSSPAQPPFSSHSVAGESHRFAVGIDSLHVRVFPFGRDGRVVEAEWKSHDGEGKTLRRVFPRGIFRLDIADITGDPFPEVLVGVVKRTRFDRVPRPRLAVYRITKTALRPLWLGSHMGMQMTDFRVARTSEGTVLLVVSRERRAGRYAVSAWSWGSFGPTFTRYLARGLRRSEAERTCLLFLGGER